MSNNLVIQVGTALSKQTIFSSLRQEIIRRMYNCCPTLDLDERINVIENFIQLMVNSGHAYSFIKAVTLQGLTKYKSMVDRSKLDASKSKYLPLYRSKDFHARERILIKYVEAGTWFTDIKLGDKYRNDWKGRLNNKRGFKKPSPNKCDVTTTLFIPPSKDALLLKLVNEVEEKLQTDLSWKPKVLEQSGTPLLLSFGKKYTMKDGCPRGVDCFLCENKGTNCTPRGVVYLASCKSCKEKLKNCNAEDINYLKQKWERGRYVGETSRPIRERVYEHMENMKKWKVESFQLMHWMQEHSTETVPPCFEFKILSAYPDPLRRQLSEALNIMDAGTLNRKLEFNSNDVCRMVSTQNKWDLEEEVQRDISLRKQLDNDLTSFISVMRDVSCNSVQALLTKRSYRDIYNFKECKRTSKRLKMETSTPKNTYRDNCAIKEQLDDSSLDAELLFTSSDMSGGGNGVINNNDPTGISLEVVELEITPPAQDSSSTIQRNLLIGALDLSDAAVRSGAMLRTSSLPNLLRPIESNSCFVPCGLRRSPQRKNFGGELRWNEEEGGVQLQEGRVSESSYTEVIDNVRKIVLEDKDIKNPNLGVVKLGEGASEELLNQPASPGVDSIKRFLKISPDTLMGRSEKVVINDGSPKLKLREVPFGELKRSHSCGPSPDKDYNMSDKGWSNIKIGRTRALSFGEIILVDPTQIEGKMKKKSTRKSRIAAVFDTSGKENSPSRGGQRLISSMVRNNREKSEGEVFVSPSHTSRTLDVDQKSRN